MVIKVYRPTHIFVENMSTLLSATNPGITINKKTVALIYHFFGENISNNVV